MIGGFVASENGGSIEEWLYGGAGFGFANTGGGPVGGGYDPGWSVDTLLTPGGGTVTVGTPIGSVGVQTGGSAPGADPRRATTQIVDSAEAFFKQNLSEFQRGTKSAAQALRDFDSVWEQMRSALLNWGSVGQRALAERDRTYAAGQYLRWDWLAWYRDPIAGYSGSRPGEGVGLSGSVTEMVEQVKRGGLAPLVVIGVLALLAIRK